ncbi:MAG: 3-oxoacyl-ACP synthase, partial [Cryomorphaceae bacterium]
MNKNFASITALGSYLPSKILNNQDLEKMVDTNDDWILTRTGIKERRILDKGIGTSFMAIKAAKQIIQKKKLDP